MRNKDTPTPHQDPLSDRAAEWHVKRERGLSAKESAQLDAEIASDPELRRELDAFAESQHFAQILPPAIAQELLAETAPLQRASKAWRVLGAAAAVLILGFGLYFFNTASESVDYRQNLTATAQIRTHVLPDGSLIRLNTDSEIEVRYSKEKRSIQLLKGEALFEVAKDRERPFTVAIGQIKVEAVGTAFNIRYSDTIDVIVTEGIISIASESTPLKKAPKSSPVSAAHAAKRVIQGQRALVTSERPSSAPEIEVSTPASGTVEHALNWYRSLLTIEAECLESIASSFEQKTGYRLVIADPDLKQLQFGGRFPSDDVIGFLNILDTGYGIPWKKGNPGEFIIGERNANQH